MSSPAPLTLRRALAALRQVADTHRCARCHLPIVAVAVELRGRGTGRDGERHYTAASYTQRCTCPPEVAPST